MIELVLNIGAEQTVNPPYPTVAAARADLLGILGRVLDGQPEREQALADAATMTVGEVMIIVPGATCTMRLAETTTPAVPARKAARA